MTSYRVYVYVANIQSENKCRKHTIPPESLLAVAVVVAVHNIEEAPSREAVLDKPLHHYYSGQEKTKISKRKGGHNLNRIHLVL
jgi:hypothetical protein